MIFNSGYLVTFGGSYLMQEEFNTISLININDKCPNKCSNNGICHEKFGCRCNEGFFLKDCSMQMQCRESCNNGVCGLSENCVCNKGWTGI